MSTEREAEARGVDANFEGSLLESSLSDPASLHEHCPLDAAQLDSQNVPTSAALLGQAQPSAFGQDQEIAALKADIDKLRKLSASSQPRVHKRNQDETPERADSLSTMPTSTPLSAARSDPIAVQGVAPSPAQQRASEIQRVLQEARAARAVADQAKWIKEKMAENSPDWKSIVRHHLGSNGDKVDEIRVAREAWVLERHRGSDGKHELGKLSTELEEMRHILTSIVRTIPHGMSPVASSLGYSTPLGSKNNSPQHRATNHARTPQPPILALHSPIGRTAHLNNRDYEDSAASLVGETEELYKKLFGRYPSRQSLIDFCSETMRMNIRPYLPAPTPERSQAHRTLGELSSASVGQRSGSAWEGANGPGTDLQCTVCGSPMATRGARGGFLSDSPSVHSTIMPEDGSPALSDVLSRAASGSLSRDFQGQDADPLGSPAARFGIAPLRAPEAMTECEEESSGAAGTAHDGKDLKNGSMHTGPSSRQEVLLQVSTYILCSACSSSAFEI